MDPQRAPAGYQQHVQALLAHVERVALEHDRQVQQVLTDLGAPAGPLKAYAAFIEAWFRDKAEQDGETPAEPSPPLQAFQALTAAQQADFARLADLAPAQLGPSHPHHAVLANGHNQGQDVMEPYISWVARGVDNVLSNLHANTATNYHVLLSPPFPPAPTFPVMFHSETAKSFWDSLRGGGAAGLTKFLSLTHPTTTTKRLAMPEGSRSLDVKAKLNHEMRVRLREVSGMEDAEMKWTRPATLEGHLGVVLVGWPYPRDQPEEDELPVSDRAIPMRNPSTNSMQQNKRLVEMLERGDLRFIRVSDLTPEQLEHVQQQHIQKRMHPVINGTHDNVGVPSAPEHDPAPASPAPTAANRAHQTERSRAQRKRVRMVTTLRPPGMTVDRSGSNPDGVQGAESLVGVGVGDNDNDSSQPPLDILPSEANAAELDAAQQIQYSDFVAQLAYLPPGGQQHPPTSNSRDGAEALDQPSLHALLAASTAMLPENEADDPALSETGQKRQREDDDE